MADNKLKFLLSFSAIFLSIIVVIKICEKLSLAK